MYKKNIIIFISIFLFIIILFTIKDNSLFTFLFGIDLIKYNKIDLNISIGMIKDDVESILGSPYERYNKEIYNKRYEYYKKGLKSSLKMPISNYVYIYYYKPDTYLYIFFDDEDKVEMIFWGNSDVKPFWH